MNLYQLKYDRFTNDFDDEDVEPVLLVNEKRYTKEQFQSIIKSEKFSMGHYQDYHDLIKKLERYGFYKIITAYFDDI